MIDKQKQILLKELCCRLPYGVILRIDIQPGGYVNRKLSDISNIRVNEYYNFEDVRPYLRPMSSMTEEEIKEWDIICVMMRNMPIESISIVLEFVNSKHLDYNNLIPKGLALEAPDGMYNV